jgi:hypothetical protein
MARDINVRLQALKARRSGTDKPAGLALDQLVKAYGAAASTDLYEKRSKGKQHTEYALGAMQEVGPDYTRLSLETAERVGNQLERGLASANIPVEFKLQGSVPANVHIRGYSDVDLLVLRADFYTYALAGPKARAGGYTTPTSRQTPEVLLELRDNSTKILQLKFPEADVDTTGGKAVKISGGSLARAVDVVPSHWFDTVGYQASRDEADRCVTIYDRKAREEVNNYPFKHIQLLDLRDAATSRGLKKAIRLCKNVNCDAEAKIGLSSFEVASLMYHADHGALQRGGIYELAILAEAQRFLDFLYRNGAQAAALKVPDGSRCILDTQAKRDALTSLSYEVDTLAREVSKEQSAALRLYETAGFDEVGRVLRDTYIPAA